jgi:hypothetical protein
MMCGIWNYTQVSKGDSSLFEVNSEDLMILGNDSSFTYDIQSVNKHSKGSWTYSDHVLHLKYIKPDTIRHFKIKKLSAATLEMEENGVVFKFVKVD